MRSILMFGSFALAAAACAPAPEAAPAADNASEARPAGAAELAPAPSPEAALAAADAAADAVDPLTDRLWALTPDDGRPGAFRVFLSSGAMMQGSCVETYRISAWRRDDAGKIIWNEDGTDISADVVAIDESALSLGLNLADGQKVETYAPAAAPFVCPDLPR